MCNIMMFYLNKEEDTDVGLREFSLVTTELLHVMPETHVY